MEDEDGVDAAGLDDGEDLSLSEDDGVEDRADAEAEDEDEEDLCSFEDEGVEEE